MKIPDEIPNLVQKYVDEYGTVYVDKDNFAFRSEESYGPRFAVLSQVPGGHAGWFKLPGGGYKSSKPITLPADAHATPFQAAVKEVSHAVEQTVSSVARGAEPLVKWVALAAGAVLLLYLLTRKK